MNEELVDLIREITSEKDDARRIMENGNYMSGASIPPSSVAPGDIYSDGTEFFINIRAECDTARLKNGKVQVYALKGELLSEKDFVAKNNQYLGKYNQLLANETYFVIPYICGGKIIKVSFNQIFTVEYCDTDQSIVISNKKLTRVGRILSPYSRKLQQKYSQFLTRIGLTSIPKILRD